MSSQDSTRTAIFSPIRSSRTQSAATPDLISSPTTTHPSNTTVRPRSASESSESIPEPDESSEAPEPFEGLFPYDKGTETTPLLATTPDQQSGAPCILSRQVYSHILVPGSLEQPQPSPPPTLLGMPRAPSRWPKWLADALVRTLLCQALMGLGVALLSIYCLLNMGWWTGMERAAWLAFGAGFLTSIVIVPTLYKIEHAKPTDDFWMSRLKTFFGMAFHLLLLGINVTAGVMMFSAPGKNFRNPFDKPPVVEWWTANGLMWLQFPLSAYCMFKIATSFSKLNANQRAIEGPSDRNLGDYSSENDPSRARAKSIRTHYLVAEGDVEAHNTTLYTCGSSSEDHELSRSRLLPSEALHGSSEDPYENSQVERPSEQYRGSVNAKGKQKATWRDDVDNSLDEPADLGRRVDMYSPV